MEKKITTKASYELARFMNKSVRHRHKWKRLLIKKKKNKKAKWVKDKTGSFIECSICGECVFLDAYQTKRYAELSKIKGKEIQIQKKKKSDM